MGWAVHQSQIRFDVRAAERLEYERLFNHQARVLQDRLARRGRTGLFNHNVGTRPLVGSQRRI